LTLLVGSALALSTTHGLSHLGHLLVGYGGHRSAARILRKALVATTVAGTLATASLWLAGVAGASLCVALAQLVYVVAATAIMVFEKERLLFLSLVPGIAASVTVLAAGDPRGASLGWVAGGLVGCLLLAVTCAIWTTYAVEREREGGIVRLVRPEVVRSLAHGLYGALVAGLLMYAVLDALWSHEGVSGGSHALVGVGMLPLVLTLGVAEWQLHLFRSDSDIIQRRTHDFRAFAREVRLSFVLRVVAYALVLGLATAAVALPVWMDGSADRTVVARLAGYVVLGVALFVASILLSCGILARTVLAVGAALAAQLTLLAVLRDPVLTVTLAQTGVFAALLAVLSVMAWRAFRSPLWFR
jgi:hypothetical protein